MKETSWASSAAVRRVMQSNRPRDTAPEWAVRRAVHALGLRYRVSVRPEPALRRTADLVFTRARVAVFVDGCFWHGCPEHRTHPRTNATYWAEKIDGTIARDLDTTSQLEATGWTVAALLAARRPRRGGGRHLRPGPAGAAPRGRRTARAGRPCHLAAAEVVVVAVRRRPVGRQRIDRLVAADGLDALDP